MNSSGSSRILSRLTDDEFFGRRAELDDLCSLAAGPLGEPDASGRVRRRAGLGLVLGPPRIGKSEILLRCFDRLFVERGRVAPFYLALRRHHLDPQRFARTFLSHFLTQFIAFRRGDARLMGAADEPLGAISRAAQAEDYLWVRGLVDSFSRAADSGDASLMVRSALSAPRVAASRTRLSPFVIVDDVHLLAGAESNESGADLKSELIRTAAGSRGVHAPASDAGPAFALSGLRRPTLDLMPPDEELLGGLELIRIEPLDENALEQLIRSSAARFGLEIGDSTAELMIHQLNRDLFYIKAVLAAAASQGVGLRTFMSFERVYTAEVMRGRIGCYLGALLREVAGGPRGSRCALDALEMTLESRGLLPIDAVLSRIGEDCPDAQGLLERLHAHELVEINAGFVRGPSDPVLADYVRAKYVDDIGGAKRPLAGETLLRDKLKQSYELMMSRYNRNVESNLIELLSEFDFQSAAASLLDQAAFGKRYRGMSRVQVRRSLDEEPERVRLPQIVMVNDVGSGERGSTVWRLFAAAGFEGGIYSEKNEVTWLVALVNSKEALDVETLVQIDRELQLGARALQNASGGLGVVRWYLSKEGFSAAAADRIAAMRAYASTYTQMDLLRDYLARLAPVQGERRPASEFELVIPIEDEAELIAARMVEQIAKSAHFEQEAINQIKTALIEACINAAEHSDSPDRRIYQRFAVDDDRLIITVSNKGKSYVPANGENGKAPAAAESGLGKSRGRGLQIIQALMDEVRLEPTDDGTRLVMVKRFQPPPQDSGPQ